MASPEHTDFRTYGRIGALESWARTADRPARTANARAAFLARFESCADPEAARKAYFARLALKSAQTRRRKKTNAPAEAEAPDADLHPGEGQEVTAA